MNSFQAKPDPTTKPEFGFEDRVNCRPVSLSRFLRTGLFRAAMGAILVCLFSWPTFADVQLHLKNGQVIHADQIGSETDGHRIAIVNKQSGISLTRYREWNNIRSISIDGILFKKSAVLKQFGAAEKNQPQFSLGEVNLVSPVKPTVSTISVSEIPPPNEEALPFCRRILGPEAYRPEALYLNPLPMESRVIGVRSGPLSTYEKEVSRFFPHGVSPSEAGFVQELMRTLKAREVLDAPPNPQPQPKINPPKKRARIELETTLLRSLPIENLPIQSVRVHAVPVSARGLADWDSLAVRLMAFDKNSRPVRFSGTVEFTLYGREQQLLRSSGSRFVAMPGRSKKLATWTRLANRGLASNPPRLLLTLPSPAPEHDLSLAPWGELTVRVLIPGHGVFVTRQAMVPLRQQGFLRGSLPAENGSRFFPGELTSGRRRSTPTLLGSQSSISPNGRILSVQP